MVKVLITGGCGFIGSHCAVDFLESGFEVVNVDSNVRSYSWINERVEELTGKKVPLYNVDVTCLEDLRGVFKEHPDIKAVIHFAAYKAVGESVMEPVLYYRINMVGLLNLLSCCEEFGVPNVIFSSSATVYGNPDELPVTEETPLKEPESCYGRTKLFGEGIVRDFCGAMKLKEKHMQSVILRYFNPIGAHPSAKIGELPLQRPENLVPYITQTAIGRRDVLTVFGNDYDTRDGTCIRDYINVMDIAHAHTLAVKYLCEGKNAEQIEVFNLGTGEGVSVKECIDAFESVNNVKLNYVFGDRRTGDVTSLYCKNDRARECLGWTPTRSVRESLRSAWEWEKQIAKDAEAGKLELQ